MMIRQLKVKILASQSLARISWTDIIQSYCIPVRMLVLRASG
jgi:hypothetical protein